MTTRHYSADDVTLYVPCFKAAATIQEVLTAITTQTAPPAAILLVDDGSSPPLDLDVASHPRVSLIRHERNLGLASARNTALSHCLTPLLASVDADVVPQSDWLEHLLNAFNANEVSGGGGRLDEKFQDTLGDRWRAVHMAQHWGDSPLFNPRFLYGANTLFSTDALRAAGGYNISLKTNFEDMLLSETLYLKGHKLFYTPMARCRHLRRDTEASVLPGFWSWYKDRGALKGDFDSTDGLIDRVDKVAFGIFRHRYDMDAAAGRNELLKLDLLLPWVFCALDLRHAWNVSHIEPPAFPPADHLPEVSLLGDLRGIIPLVENTTKADWHASYLEEFAACLAKHKWLDCHHVVARASCSGT